MIHRLPPRPKIELYDRLSPGLSDSVSSLRTARLARPHLPRIGARTRGWRSIGYRASSWWSARVAPAFAAGAITGFAEFARRATRHPPGPERSRLLIPQADRPDLVHPIRADGLLDLLDR